MTSSLRRFVFPASPRRALVIQGGMVVGAVDLPERAAEFIEQFNVEYAVAGLSLRWTAEPGGTVVPTGDES